MAKAKKSGLAIIGISKCPTGIHGLDEVTFGGLPRGRPTLVCGGAGCGKTLLGMEFLVRGAGRALNEGTRSGNSKSARASEDRR